MFRFKFYVCWQTEYKNMSSIWYLCLRIVLDIDQVDSSQDSRTVKLQTEEFINCKARPIETQILN